jgi:hypothetical protein
LQSSSAETTKPPGLRGARKLTDLSNLFGGATSLGANKGFPTTSSLSFTGAGINFGPTTTTTTNFNSGLFEGAGGNGGGAAFGQGSTSFDLDDVSNLKTMNSGFATSMGGAFGIVGLGAGQGAKSLTDIFGTNTFGVSGGSRSGNP